MVLSSVIDVAGLESDSITNGPGLRFVLFAQGCPHHCVGCHNPQTHRFGIGQKFTVDELFSMIADNPLQTGVTFSGGEPFCQAGPLAELARKVRARGLDVAVYTGFTMEHLLDTVDPGVRDLLDQTDVLVDGKFVLKKRDALLRFRGSDNQRILNAPESVRLGTPVPLHDDNW